MKSDLIVIYLYPEKKLNQINMIGLIESTEKLFADALSTMRKKNADYAGDSDSMKNFQVSALVANVKMSQGILTRLTDKTTRIGNLILKDASVKEETIFDTVQDLINYAAILHYALQMERREKTYRIEEKVKIEDVVKPEEINEFTGFPESAR